MFVRGNRLLKQSRDARSAQFPVLFTFLILVVVALVLLFGKNGDKSSLTSNPLNQKWNSFDSMVRLDPIIEFRNGTDLVWQIPDSPKAVLFLAHGCNGRAVNFWDKSPNCPNCVGLPEERLIVLHALARKFAVLAVSSKGICWSLGEERWIVKDTIRWWIAKQKLEKLPVFALGASSGGYFISVLATELKFREATCLGRDRDLGGKFCEIFLQLNPNLCFEIVLFTRNRSVCCVLWMYVEEAVMRHRFGPEHMLKDVHQSEIPSFLGTTTGFCPAFEISMERVHFSINVASSVSLASSSTSSPRLRTSFLNSMGSACLNSEGDEIYPNTTLARLQPLSQGQLSKNFLQDTRCYWHWQVLRKSQVLSTSSSLLSRLITYPLDNMVSDL